MKHLETRCYICYDKTNEKSRPMPCCNNYLHESCLSKAFYNTYKLLDYKCPFCRTTVQPYNNDEPFFLDRLQPDEVGFDFRTLTFIRGKSDWSASDHLFL